MNVETRDEIIALRNKVDDAVKSLRKQLLDLEKIVNNQTERTKVIEQQIKDRITEITNINERLNSAERALHIGPYSYEKQR